MVCFCTLVNDDGGRSLNEVHELKQSFTRLRDYFNRYSKYLECLVYNLNASDCTGLLEA